MGNGDLVRARGRLAVARVRGLAACWLRRGDRDRCRGDPGLREEALRGHELSAARSAEARERRGRRLRDRQRRFDRRRHREARRAAAPARRAEAVSRRRFRRSSRSSPAPCAGGRRTAAGPRGSPTAVTRRRARPRRTRSRWSSTWCCAVRCWSRHRRDESPCRRLRLLNARSSNGVGPRLAHVRQSLPSNLRLGRRARMSSQGSGRAWVGKVLSCWSAFWRAARSLRRTRATAARPADRARAVWGRSPARAAARGRPRSREMRSSRRRRNRS